MVKNLDRLFFRFVTMHAFDRQTDGQTDGRTDGQTDRNLIARPRLHSMQRGKNVQNFATGRKIDRFPVFFTWVELSCKLIYYSERSTRPEYAYNSTQLNCQLSWVGRSKLAFTIYNGALVYTYTSHKPPIRLAVWQSFWSGSPANSHWVYRQAFLSWRNTDS